MRFATFLTLSTLIDKKAFSLIGEKAFLFFKYGKQPMHVVAGKGAGQIYQSEIYKGEKYNSENCVKRADLDGE